MYSEYGAITEERSITHIDLITRELSFSSYSKGGRNKIKSKQNQKVTPNQHLSKISKLGQGDLSKSLVLCLGFC